MYDVSIIVPTHNNMPYIKETMNDIIGQTFTDYEVILVDDGSVDGTLEFINTIANNNTNFSVINNSENGAASSRNLGMTFAKGEFVIFLDADDRFSSELVSIAVAAQRKNNADLIVWSFIVNNKLSNRRYKRCVIPFIKNTMDISEDDYIFSADVPWNKMIRKQLLFDNKIEFQNLPTNNDIFFSYAVISTANKIEYIDDILTEYIYGQKNSLSIMRSEGEDNSFDAYDAFIEYLEANKKDNIKKIIINYLLRICAWKIITSSGEKKEKIIAKWKYSDFKKKINQNMNLLDSAAVKFVQLMNTNDMQDYNFYNLFSDDICDLKEKVTETGEKLILWGAGIRADMFLRCANELGLKVSYIVDIDEKKWGQTLQGISIKKYDEKNRDKILFLNKYIMNDITKKYRDIDKIHIGL